MDRKLDHWRDLFDRDERDSFPRSRDHEVACRSRHRSTRAVLRATARNQLWLLGRHLVVPPPTATPSRGSLALLHALRGARITEFPREMCSSLSCFHVNVLFLSLSVSSVPAVASASPKTKRSRPLLPSCNPAILLGIISLEEINNLLHGRAAMLGWRKIFVRKLVRKLIKSVTFRLLFFSVKSVFF